MISIGFDPGINGCIAVLEDGIPVDHLSLSAYKFYDPAAKKGASRIHNIDALCSAIPKFLRSFPVADSITIEKTAAYRIKPSKKKNEKEDKQAFSLDSIYKLGFNSSIPEVFLTMEYPGVDRLKVHPTTWKAAIGIGKQPKGTDKKKLALKFAREMEGWEEYAAKHLTRALDHDVAEALLIAKYGYDKARYELFR